MTKDSSFLVRLPKEDLDAFNDILKQKTMNRSELLRKWIKEYIRENNEVLKMQTFIINYNNGFTIELEGNDLREVQKVAEEQMSYTGQNITIETEDGQILAVSRWYGYEPSEGEKEDGFVLTEFGNSGFYGTWEEDF